MPAAPAAISPWPRGMNNRVDITTLSDDQVALALNLDFEQDGSAYSRPAIVVADSGPAAAELRLIGWYLEDDGTRNLVGTCNGKTWAYDIDAETWTQIWTSVAADCVQYNDNLVLISETTAGGYWNGTSFTSTPTMPLGSQIEVLQERFWASGVPGGANENRVWFSNQTVISPASSIYDWTTAQDFFEVNAGDGQHIAALRLAPQSNALLIFRTQSTWVWSYPALPIDGTLRQLSTTIGADNAWCVEAYEGYFFVMSQGFLYQFINYQFYPLNARTIDFARTALDEGQAIDLRVSLLGSRVIVWYLGSCYVYDAVTQTWSQWDSPTTRAAHFLQVPADVLNGDDRIAYAVSGESDPAKRSLYRIQESPLISGAGEEIACVLRTKAYAFDTPGEFKRQPYYRVEVQTAFGLEGGLYPQELPPGGATIDEMEGVIIDVFELGSWDNPLVVLTVLASEVQFPAASPTRIHVEMIAPSGDIHFRRMIYEIRGQSGGTRATGPFKIYSITPMLTLKAKARFQVS